MNFIDEQIELLKRKHADPLYVAPNLQEVIPQDNDNNEQGLGTWLGAAGIGAGNMLNNTIFGGLGQLLGGIGAGVEFISPFSGNNADKRVELMRLGIPHEVTQSIYPDEDSWITSLGKGSLEIQNAIGDKLGQWRNDVVGDNPSYGTQVGEGVGSSIGFMGAGQAASALAGLAGAGPIGMAIAGLLAMGATEALSESGGVLGDAYRQGKYDEGLSAANKSFATNLALNTTLDSLGGFFSPLTTGIRNPITKFGVRTLGQIGNELLQEPSQQTIEKAAQDSIYNGGNFMNALGKRAGEWGQDFMNLVPSVAGSSLITSLLTGAGGLAIPSVRQQVASQYQHKNESSEQAEERIKAHLDAIQALQNRIEKEKTTGNNQDIIDSLNRRIQQRQNQIQRLANTFSITKVDYTPKNLQEQNSTEQQTQQPVQGQQLQAPQIKNAPPHITTGSNEAYYGNDYYSDNGGDNSNPEQDIPETHTPDTVPQNINALGKKPEPEKTVITEALNNATTSQPENHNTGTGGKNQPQRNSTSDEFSQFIPDTETPRNPDVDNSPMGNNSIVEAGGKDYAVRYRVLDVRNLITSHKLSGGINDNYDQSLQNRQRENMASRLTIENIARNINPRLLTANPMASDGAPIIGSDGQVESGNGRILALLYAYLAKNRDGSTWADHYRHYITEHAQEFGLNPDDIDAIECPVLVRERWSEANRKEFTRAANKSSQAGFSKTERALDDVDRLTPELLHKFDPDKDIETQHDFISAYANAVVDKSEIPDFIQANTLSGEFKLSKSGLERIKNTLFAKAYGDAGILQRLNEVLGSEAPAKNFSNAIIKAAPKLAIFNATLEAANNRADNEGVIAKNNAMAIAPDIKKALEIFTEARCNHTNVDSVVAQGNFISHTSKEAEAIAKFCERNIRSPKRIANALNYYADEASDRLDLGQFSFYSKKPITKMRLLQEAFDRAEGKTLGLSGTDDIGFQSGYGLEDGMVIGDKAKLSQVSENYAGQSTNTQGANVRKTEAGGVSANAVRIPIPKGQRPGTERIDPRIQPTEVISGLQGLQGLSDDDRMNAAKALMPPNFVQRITPDTNIHVETVRGLPETQRATVEDLTALTDEEKQQLHETLTGRKLRPEAHKINPDENMRVDTERITTNVQKPDAVRGFTDIQRAGIQDLTALPDETKEQVYETLTGRKLQPNVQRISPAGNMHVDARRVPIPKGQMIPTTRLDFSRQRNTQNQQDNITEDSPPFDGYIASFQIGAGDASANVHAFFDTQDGQPFIGIADENGHFIATYDMKNNQFYINEGNQNHSVVKRWGMDRIEKDFKFAFTDNAEGEFNLDYSKNPTEEILRKVFMGKAINAGEIQERADSLSRIYMEMNKNLASQTGIPLLDMVMADNMSIQKLNRMDENSDRGNTKIIPQTDINGNPVLEAQHIVSLFKNSDESTLLHELWHFYQEKIKRLGNAGLIKSGTNLFDDWQAIRSEAGMLQTDFRQPLSVEDNTKWRNSHEKNATSFEKYLRKGLAPEGISKKMQKVFDNFREWLKNVYFKVRDIFYTDAQGYKHNNFAVNPRIRKVFDHIFTGNKKLNNNNNTNTQQNPSFKTDYTGIQDFRQSENNGGFFGWLKRIGKHILHPLYSIAHVEHKPSAIDRIAPFPNPETERRFTEAGKPIPRQGVLGRISHAFKDAAKSIIAGDFSDITNSPRISDKTLNLRGALQSLRTLDRNKKYALEQGREQILNVLKSLKTPQQYELFNRLRVLQDLDWQIQNMPESQLPFDLTHDDVKKALKQYTDLAHQRGNEAVLKAIHDEEQNMREINEDYIKLSGELGMNMDGVFSNPHYYRHRIIQYAQAIRAGKKHVYSQANQNIQDTVNSLMRETMNRGWLKKRKGSTMDFITDYMEANSEVRIQQLQDIETMKTLLEIKKNFDIAPRIRKQFKLGNVKEDTKPNGAETFSQSGNGEQESILDHIPEGHEAFDINGWSGIEGNKTVPDNMLNMAVSKIAEESGIPVDSVFETLGIVDAGNNIMVIPTEIANTLRKMAKISQRGAVAQAAKDFTTWWKRSVLFTPTRNLLYNIRNFTGDLDAVIAGNPHALKYLPQSVKELVEYYTKHGKEGYQASQDLQDYIRLSGSLGIQSLNLSKDDARALVDLLTVSNPDKMSKLGKKRGAALEQRINDYASQDTDIGALKKAWWHKWNLIAKLFDLEHKGTELREHLLRFATYLDYKQQMEGNKNGKPNNWGASLEDEVMAVKDIKERAFKMSNELLGAYDQVSEIGKQLRDMMIPFYSWMEVNMRRTWRLLRNGFKYGKGREAVQKYLTGKLYTMPLYAVPAAYSLSKLLLFTGALQMFNRFWAPDADDDLPNDVKYRPHLTFGKRNGRVYYFDRIGAIADALDWFSLDSAVLDAKDFANGQKTLGSWFKQMVQAPFSKAINGLNPAIKMPIELAMGRSMFPDAFNPSTIRDPAEYIARSFGMAWPYKAITGKPHDNLQELSHLVVYSQDVDEAAYWQTLDRVRQFQTQVLDKHFDGFASTARGRILQNLKKALRYRDNAAIRRYLREYAQADGTKQGLKASMKAMNPLHGLNEKEKAQFMKWLSADDRKYLRKAERYYHQLADRFIR